MMRPLRVAVVLALALTTFRSPDAGAQAAGDVLIDRDVRYGEAGGQALLLDIYQPKERPRGTLPAIVMIHGGGWRAWPDGKWTKSTDADTAKAFARKGYWVASVEYRLSDVARFPAAVLDCKRAIRWVRAHAAEQRIDPEKIGVWGFSAGGHLALLMG